MSGHEPRGAFAQHRFRIAAAVISLLVWGSICSEAAFAQASAWPKYREWEVEAFAGGSFVGSFQFPTPVSGSAGATASVGMHYASGYVVGLRITQYAGEPIAVGLEYSFANQPLRFTNLSPEIPSLSVGHSIQHFNYNVSYMAATAEQRFRPYGSLGAGAVSYHISKNSKAQAAALGVGLHGTWEFALNAGGGFKYLVEDQFVLTFNVKDQISKVPSYGLPGSASILNGFYQPGIARHGLLNNWQINIGAAFQWDD